MNGLVFVPATNKPGIDPKTGAPYKDAKYFAAEAKKFGARHGIPLSRVVTFDNCSEKRERRAFVADTLMRFQNLECVAFFCHGWREGIQAGFALDHAPELARYLFEACVPGAKIPLYCCSTAEGGAGGDGAFADTLRDSLVGMLPGAVIDAHDRRGPTTTNPYVRRFVVGKEREKGGQWVIDPTDTRWPAWRKALRDTPLRFDFPFLATETIRSNLPEKTP